LVTAEKANCHDDLLPHYEKHAQAVFEKEKRYDEHHKKYFCTPFKATTAAALASPPQKETAQL